MVSSELRYFFPKHLINLFSTLNKLCALTLNRKAPKFNCKSAKTLILKGVLAWYTRVQVSPCVEQPARVVVSSCSLL